MTSSVDINKTFLIDVFFHFARIGEDLDEIIWKIPPPLLFSLRSTNQYDWNRLKAQEIPMSSSSSLLKK